MRRDQGEQGNIERQSTGAIAVDHAPPADRTLLIAPSAAGEFNAVQDLLTPVACVQLSDVLFEFDSSIVRPDARGVMKSLARLREEDQQVDAQGVRPASVFGHADPTGDDNYNKALSGRRAQAIYGLLTRRTDLWEDLHQNPLGGDDWRGGGVQSMESALGRPPGSTSGAAGRAELFRAYMDFICVDDTDQPFVLDPTADFLGRGVDANGKADFQGCSEFNPLRVFSQAEQQQFAGNKPERDRENAPNRRVVIFLFRAGARVDPSRWPCPRAKEGTAGCIRRFHTDGNVRRSPSAERREFDTDGNTFACRFYHQRIATLSPCERILPQKACCKRRGVVVDNVDPQGLGRLKVDVPELFEGTPRFALPAVPFAGAGVGFSMLPPVGANVWVDFEQGDIDRPVWSGCFWQAGEAPAEASQPGVSFIKTDTTKLVLKSGPVQGFEFRTESGAVVVSRPVGLQVRAAGDRIDLDGTEVRINGESLRVVR